jgi:protein subunit release factor A
MTEKRKLFSVTLADCRVDTFRGSGAGGQNRNKRDTAVRITHPPSKAVGEAKEHRTQWKNKQAAFKRMFETKEFQIWIKLEAAKKSGWDIDEQVTKDMNPKNIKIEVQDVEGKWCDENSIL